MKLSCSGGRCKQRKLTIEGGISDSDIYHLAQDSRREFAADGLVGHGQYFLLDLVEALGFYVLRHFPHGLNPSHRVIRFTLWINGPTKRFRLFRSRENGRSAICI